MEEWISLREFARRRGVTLGAVQKAIESGRVTAVKRNDAGRLISIEWHAASRQWNGNTDIDQAGRAGAPVLPGIPPRQSGAPSPAAAGEGQGSAVVEAAGTGSDPVAAAASPGTGAAEDGRYLAARAIKQEFEAKQAELDYLKALGELVSVEELQRVNARRYGMVRDKLLNIPDRLATIIAAERDPARIHAAITGELKRVLNELADDASAEAAAGAAERVAA